MTKKEIIDLLYKVIDYINEDKIEDEFIGHYYIEPSEKVVIISVI